ncbi:MAG: T9SS type A sorting domain-containing protein [Bacteroidota bacterium]
MKKIFFCLLLLIIPLSIQTITAQERATLSSIPGFTLSPYFNEQIKTFIYNPEVRIHINAPSVELFDPSKPTALSFFSLPNGNTIEMTVGKQLKLGDDWHYDIQHIGAQTRFIRTKMKDTNFVTIYLEANASSVPLSWPTWRSKYANNAVLIKSIVDSVKNIFANYNPYIILSSHSGGGGFSFSYFNAATTIPNEVKRITFLDATYNYDNAYGAKIKDWLLASSDHHLSVLAYNDSIALYNGQPIVSATGGTWYRTRQMVSYLSAFMSFTTTENATFIIHSALNGRVKIILKHNPTQAILHTVQVELNGYIQTMLSGTPLEEIGYTYYGTRAYTSLVQTGNTLPKPLQIPPRPSGSVTGSQFMTSVAAMSFTDRENAIYAEIAKGNIPDFMRTLKKLQSAFQDNDGISHTVIYEVMPDYLCIGSNEDFCRVPMGPVTAQKLANLFGATMPTTKLVDDIYTKAPLKVAPVTYAPVGNENEKVTKFIEHNTAIENQRTSSGQPLGTLMGGTKKDMVISNKIVDPTRPGYVVIYGWHQLNGTAIQPLTNIHSGSYVDYSHGVRLMNVELLVDSVTMNVKQMLTNAKWYKVLSNEIGAMTQPSYFKESNAPATPKSFGVKSENGTSLRLVIKPDTNVTEYIVFTGKNGTTFTDTVVITPNNPIITTLQTDSLYYITIKASNNAGISASSEVLAGIPSLNSGKILIVNGFDRASTGNTYNFIRMHASAVKANGYTFASATNDAVIDGLFFLNNYSVADYILGDESTIDETFSTVEQTKVKSFLQNGGKLFVSGCELAWDLDNKGAASDKDFINNYLKMRYLADAPNNVKQTTYQAEILGGNVFTGVPSIAFDNGTHGSIDVQWPDVIKGTAGGLPFAKYTNLDTASGVSGIFFSGNFPSGTRSGKLVALGFPFETIYTQSVRDQLMGKILLFFDIAAHVQKEEAIPEGFILYQNFPNPFNPTTIIQFSLSSKGERATLTIFDINGKEIVTLVDEQKEPGTYSVQWNASQYASGMYLAKLVVGGKSQIKKLLLVK